MTSVNLTSPLKVLSTYNHTLRFRRFGFHGNWRGIIIQTKLLGGYSQEILRKCGKF